MLKQGQIDFDNPSFYNTIDEIVRLREFEASAKSQEDMVLEVFKKFKELAWFQVAGFLPDMNEVSLKRSMSNLKKKGLLFKTDIKVLGIYGKNTHKYRLV